MKGLAGFLGLDVLMKVVGVNIYFCLKDAPFELLSVIGVKQGGRALVALLHT
jgi:hypothetical protein